LNQDKRKMLIVSALCGFGYMMYSVDRMVMSTSIGLIAQEFGFSTVTSGLLMSAFFYGFIAFLFIGGVLSDRLSGKRVVIGGVLLFSVFTAATSFASGLMTMFVYRIMTGIGEGVFWPAASLEVSNVTTEKQRATVMSLYWTGYPIGGFLGTWLGANIGPVYGWRAVFYVACGLGLLISVLYAVLVKETNKADAIVKKTKKQEVPLRRLMTDRSVVMLGIYYFVLMCGWWIVLLWAPTFLMQAKHISLSTAGTIASVLGLSGALGGLLMGRYCDAGSLVRQKTLLISITILSGILMCGMVLDLPVWLITVMILLLGFFGYPVTPIILSVTSQLVPREIAGSAIGFVMNVGMIGGAISPVLAGALSVQYGMSAVWIGASVVLTLSSICLFFTGKVERAGGEKI
jgi:MFS transporter, ACS family, hexuronate transporter